MRLLYSLFIHFFAYFLFLASFFSKKAKLWCKGRKNIFLFLKNQCEGKSNIYWFHCASLGEFEQGKPLIEKIKQQKSEVTILVTFFSPSGYEIRKNDPIADIISYLPIDTKKNAKKFITIVKPKQVFFVKYEYWYNYMNELYKAGIPFYYVSAIFRKEQYFFKNYGKWFLKQLKKCHCFFVQNNHSATLLKRHGILQVVVTGDTRFDRVLAISKQHRSLDFVVSFKNTKKLLVAGSTWQPDELLLAKLFAKLSPNYKLIIAPHEVEKSNITRIKQIFSSFSILCYSEIDAQDISTYDVLVIDTIGLLSSLYKYADISYIGGAFKTGLHNILEAAVYEKPIFFGTHFQKFNEAVELVALGAAFSVNNAKEMEGKIEQFENNSLFYLNCCEICKSYVAQNLGATDKIVSVILPKDN